MSRPFFNIAPLIANIEAGQLIITPNFRLARHITQAWGQHCVDRGLLTWPQPLIMALDAWLENCWAELIESQYPPLVARPLSVIDSHGEQLLWRSCITQDSQLPPAADIPSLAELAMQTWQQLQRANVPLSELQDTHHPATESFLRWLDTFNQALDQSDLSTWEQAQSIVLQAFRDDYFPGYEAIQLVGFQTLPALHRDIINAAAKKVSHSKQKTTPANITLHPCRDENSQISAAAEWAKAQYESDPEQRIGVVFGNLANSQQQILRIFHDTFSPEHCLPEYERSIPAFNFSAGSPLSRSPLVASALNLLTVQTQALGVTYWCQLLADPFWGPTTPSIGDQVSAGEQTVTENQAATEPQETTAERANQQVAMAEDRQLIARAHCELLLRDSNKLLHTPSAFRASLAEAERQIASIELESESPCAPPLVPNGEHPSLATAWQTIAERVRRQPKTASFCYWAEEFAQRLEILGWPGARTLDSIEYQEHQHFLGLLEDFASLDNGADNPTASAALTQLSRMAQATVFQAQSHDSQIQVLGLLEAAGLAFDQLWIAGMDDRQWPQPTSLNPLLAVDLQQRHQLPRSDAKQELALAKQLLHDFQHSSQQLVFSYATRDGDTDLEASRLLPKAILNSPALAPVSIKFQQPLLAALSPTALQKVELVKAPSLQPGEQSVRGGTAILQTQAGSPFNAFATWRLGARPLAEPGCGLSPIERGNLVHRCLELFWTRFHDQASVKALDSDALNMAIEDVIAEAIQPLRQSRSDIFGPRFVAIETQRLKQLLAQWLDIELQRQPFSVLAPEKQLLMSIGGLPLSLRIDRIDRLDDQRIVLIDYKTGDTNINCWAGERLEEPQLPLYALALPEQVAGLCFGQISTPKSVTAKGVSDTPEIIPGLSALSKINFETWEDCLEVWREQLETLAAEFFDGQAEIAFYTNAALRYQGHLYPLNRWPEIAQRSNSADVTANELD